MRKFFILKIIVEIVHFGLSQILPFVTRITYSLNETEVATGLCLLIILFILYITTGRFLNVECSVFYIVKVVHCTISLYLSILAC